MKLGVIFSIKYFLTLVIFVLSENVDHKTVPELIAENGYPVETHSVTTYDGYILEMHRIPHGRNDNGTKNRPVLFLQHGLPCSSEDWIGLGPKKALGYIAADQGFDVWIGNDRGNTYSKKHLTLSPKDPKFWDFSFHEMGIYDLPAMIDYALKVSRQEKLYYIGHSQGSSSFFVMCSERPEYNKKIAAQFSLAPVIFIKRFRNPLLNLVTPNRNRLEALLRVLDWNDSINYLFTTLGFHLPFTLTHAPAGGSVKGILHFGQLLQTGEFTKYDYGSLNNFYYGTNTPPKYNLTKVTAPVALYYCKKDLLLGSEKAITRLYYSLKNPIGMFLVEDKSFRHGDFTWGKNAAELVYYKILNLAKMYK